MEGRSGALEIMALISSEFWKGKRVFVTGHTGFKGSWLCYWLEQMGAIVTGYALAPVSSPNLSQHLKFSDSFTSYHHDLRNLSHLTMALQSADPEIILHLAAQSLVSDGFTFPLDTFSTNIMGTANLLEAARSCPRLSVFLNITTDKVYENSTGGAHIESVPFGGTDPYSVSKVCSEFITNSMRASFLSEVRVATARAGNVIGGGDWTLNRLFPDIYRAHVTQTILELRNPTSVRPWQHVMDCLAGYLRFAEYLFEAQGDYVRALNFSPDHRSIWTVEEIIRFVQKNYPEFEFKVNLVKGSFKEEETLLLDSSLARETLGWSCRLSTPEAISQTMDWYLGFTEGKSAGDLISQQVRSFL